MSLAGTSDVCECIFEQHHCPEAPRYQPLRHFFLQDSDFTLASAHEGRPPAGKRGRVRRSGDSNRDKKSVLQFLQAQAIEN